MTRRTSPLLLTILVGSCQGFQMAQVFKSFQPVKVPTQSGGKKAELLDSISFTNNGKSAAPETQLNVLDIVRSMEVKSPPSPNLLSDPKEAQILDGVWYLHYTSPSDPSLIDAGETDDNFPNAWKPQKAEEKIETKQFNAKGSVSAAGINVDTSNRVVKQIINVQESVVFNEIDLDFGKVQVGGPFRKSDNIPNRAVVSFQTCNITLNSGFTLNLGFLFDILSLVRGSKDSGWLETTYIDSNMRIGRGNKGTMFVLTRNSEDVKP
ncbi:lipid-associated protein 3, chloroplastic [Seminavis robusta]|uniref:Lipid-associated protein 3, chloroplastic n=1 Tax=Seminavis robusta TaxID=568900 RepID=A0A9N8HRV6_9STRA|nr:lipid-associated protein 3, chloroplastic [Seminavis robusta]|eukprot:Sro1443_g273200.1 lipid-associated protein 3, chloroplastic (265) ;mRNA; r:27291-28435